MGDSPEYDEIVVADGTAALTVIWLGFPLLGGAAGWLVKLLAAWVAGLPWAPLQGPFRLVDQLSNAEPTSTIVALAVGAAAGLVVAYLAAADLLVVTVGPDTVRLRRGGREQQVERSSVRAVFVDGKQLVILGTSSEEMVRESCDLPSDRLADAFRRGGYPWAEADPFAAEFRRWVPDVPGLPPGADALLRARDRALQKGDDDDVTDLRRELARLGVVVREDNKRQYWRLAQSQPRDGISGSAEP